MFASIESALTKVHNHQTQTPTSFRFYKIPTAALRSMHMQNDLAQDQEKVTSLRKECAL